VIYGFRPEQMHKVERAGLAAPVTFVERIGARTIVHLGDGPAAFKAVFENDVGVAQGETVQLAPDPGSLRLFDAVSGRALGRS
jgi:multiple sugar transport system ATP-binding protein